MYQILSSSYFWMVVHVWIWFTDGVMNFILMVFNVWPHRSVTDQDYCDHDEAQSPAWPRTFPDWVGAFPKSQTLWRKMHRYNLYYKHINQNQESKWLIHLEREINKIIKAYVQCVCFFACSLKVCEYVHADPRGLINVLLSARVSARWN